MWDKRYGNLPGYRLWDDSIAVRNLFLGTEGGKTDDPTNLPYDEWDCTALFKATIYARSFALNRKSRHCKTLSDLYVSPRKLTPGNFHACVKSPNGNIDETFALAIDQLRLLRNAHSHSSNCELDRATFERYFKYAKEAFIALKITTAAIDYVKSLPESDLERFTTSAGLGARHIFLIPRSLSLFFFRLPPKVITAYLGEFPSEFPLCAHLESGVA